MLLNLIAYGIIPLYTILFAYNSNLLTSNFSVISQRFNRQLLFVSWGILIGCYFYYLLSQIIKTLPNKKNEQILLTGASCFFALSFQMPYRPESAPFQSLLHVIFACVASLLFIFCLYLIILKLYYRKRSIYRIYTIAIIWITLVSFALLCTAGIISSALEIFFIISCSILIRRLYKTSHCHDQGYCI